MNAHATAGTRIKYLAMHHILLSILEEKNRNFVFNSITLGPIRPYLNTADQSNCIIKRMHQNYAFQGSARLKSGGSLTSL